MPATILDLSKDGEPPKRTTCMAQAPSVYEVSGVSEMRLRDAKLGRANKEPAK